MSIGKLHEFNVSDGAWSSYMDRVEMYFKVNRVEEEMKVPVLIATMGDEAYELLENLASPEKPATLTLAQINELMAQHLQPAPAVLAERYRFRQRRQNVGETITMYVAELKRLSKHCKFGSNLNVDLRDQFVCGLSSDVIRQRLFAEDDKVTFTAAVKLATSLETAERDAAIVDQAKATSSSGTGEAQTVMFASRGRSSSAFGGGQAHALALTSQRRSSNSRKERHCEACGARNHNYATCKFREYVCSKCQRTGHLRRVCPDWGAGAAAGAAGRGGARAPAWRGGPGTAAPARSAMYFGDADRGSSEEHGEDIEEELHHLCLNNYQSTLYQPEGIEKWGDKIISTASTILSIGLYTSPFICFYVYKRGFFSLEDTRIMVRYLGGISCLLALSYIMRGVGRASNPKYVEFLKALTSSATDQKAYLQGIRKYDFEFQAWPATYVLSKSEKSSWLARHPFSSCANPELPRYQRTTIQVLAYVATHTFALRLIYPGSLGIIQNLLRTALFQGRTQLVEAFNGQRAKLRSADGNDLDTMFVDNRNEGPKGKILVVCCEGNSGFYEIGIMTTPVKAGFSALGWNHPGFGGSTGLPYPSQEQNAMDAVMRYAINELGFEPKQIVIYGWSIGGYAATWAAVSYPEVKALVLDATFDDLLPLAENQMPSSWSLLVKEVVRSHVDLNIGDLLVQYRGPVQLVRRTEDEIICLRPGQLSSNRGNHLLLKLIETRHPDLSAETLDKLRNYSALLETQRTSLERLDEESTRSLKLISKYMRDYRSSHCTPLPEEHFEAIMETLAARQ